MTLLSKSTTVICLLVFGAVLLAGSIGAFLFYVPFLPVTIIAVILLGMVLTFLIGARVGGTQVLRLHLIEQRIRQLRLRRNAPSEEVNEPLALAAPPDD